jgi:hypothetical protein
MKVSSACCVQAKPRLHVAAGSGRPRARADPYSAGEDALAAALGGALPPEPHLVQRFELPQNPAFAPKLRGVVKLYLGPRADSLVLSVDESRADSGP